MSQTKIVLFQRKETIMKRVLLFVAILFVMASCQPVPTPIPPTETLLPTATTIPPTNTPIPPPTAIPPTNTPIPLSTLTLTIKENNCSFEGPGTVPHTVLTINLIMDEQKPTESGYALFTLEEGKTIEDVKALTDVNPPSWVNVIHGVHEYTNGMHTYTYNYANVTTDQTLYLVCFRADPDTGVIAKVGGPFGPIEVK
jgi:hypothetical protein